MSHHDDKLPVSFNLITKSFSEIVILEAPRADPGIQSGGKLCVPFSILPCLALSTYELMHFVFKMIERKEKPTLAYL